MDLNLSPPPRLRYPCRPAEMCAWKRAGPRAIILPLIFLFEIKPQREHMRESEEGQKTRLWITSSEGGGSLQQQNCPIGEALPLSQTESFCPTVISFSLKPGCFVRPIITGITTNSRRPYAPNTFPHPPPSASFHHPVSHLPSSLFGK